MELLATCCFPNTTPWVFQSKGRSGFCPTIQKHGRIFLLLGCLDKFHPFVRLLALYLCNLCIPKNLQTENNKLPPSSRTTRQSVVVLPASWSWSLLRWCESAARNSVFAQKNIVMRKDLFKNLPTPDNISQNAWRTGSMNSGRFQYIFRISSVGFSVCACVCLRFFSITHRLFRVVKVFTNQFLYGDTKVLTVQATRVSSEQHLPRRDSENKEMTAEQHSSPRSKDSSEYPKP